MIISDLNYMEATNEEVFGGTTKNISLKSSVNQDFKVNIDIDARKRVNSDINAKSNVKGNSAVTVFDNTALGRNSYVETNVSNFTEAGYGSESSGTLFAAANY